MGEDGATHHGVYDLASMLPIPNITVLAPRDIQELEHMVRWTETMTGPCAIRYGKKSVDMSGKYPYGHFTPGKWEILEDGADCVLLAVGSMVTEAVEVRELLARHHVDAAVVNCSTVKPMDEQMLRCLAGRPWITMEEHVLTGGFGAQVCSWCVGEECPPPALTFGIADTFVQHGDRDLLLKYLGLQPKQMARRIRAALEEKKNG